jgi:hypothetical protein
MGVVMNRSLFAFCIVCGGGFIFADTYTEINKEIDQLQNEIDQHRTNESNINLDSQHYMFGQPEKYADAMKRIEKLDYEIDVLEKKLQELKAEHDKLLKEIKPPEQ